jgi:N-acetyl-gamma-glutamyl-phosphate reductase
MTTEHKKQFGVAIVGGSGYGAGELLRITLDHPAFEVCCVTSRSHLDKPVSSVHTHLEGLTSLRFSESVDLARLHAYKRSAVVLAMPSGQAVPATRELLNSLDETCIIIDLSGDLRLKDPETHARFYPEVAFDADLHQRFLYSLPEVTGKDLSGARLITNPGCLATAAILSLAPLRSLQARGSVVIDAKTGTSGAGREPQASMHHPARFADFTAYKVLQHRHEPEITQALGAQFSQNFSTMFVPHLLPVSRGIFVTAYISLESEEQAIALRESYHQFYKDQPLIRMRTSAPRLADVVGTAFCDLHIVTRGSQVVAMATIDNLGKGMATQAVQNLNIGFGLPQETGLLASSLGPV